ncbi:unnamed protein product [Protopolystoma xenopodis]|uniref:Uncharacterized protein n=1 Tax=Protopolystoma xenopodis TaxID=117903 RepID=A0A3S5AED5_9PLAT|nr:unnamed protein product [Protopolystoma xenopodis]
MYTNISDEKAISAWLEILDREEDILEVERIQKESLTRRINLTVTTTYFTFNGRIFGSPLLANVYMDKLEKEFEKSPLQPKECSCDTWMTTLHFGHMVRKI